MLVRVFSWIVTPDVSINTIQRINTKPHERRRQNDSKKQNSPDERDASTPQDFPQDSPTQVPFQVTAKF